MQQNRTGRPRKQYRENLIPISDTSNITIPITTIYQKSKDIFKIVGYSCYLCGNTFKAENTAYRHQISCKSINTIYDYTQFDIIRNTDMPIQTVTIKGEKFYRWGDQGKVYRNREDAEKQARAIYASGYKEPKKDMKGK